jgi:hypothetical protein
MKRRELYWVHENKNKVIHEEVTTLAWLEIYGARSKMKDLFGSNLLLHFWQQLLLTPSNPPVYFIVPYMHFNATSKRSIYSQK